MKEIFAKIKGREWDWFGGKPENFFVRGKYLFEQKGIHEIKFSLADLLSNRSWCSAVWGEEPLQGTIIKSHAHFSINAFMLLWGGQYDAAIRSIKRTMKD